MDEEDFHLLSTSDIINNLVSNSTTYLKEGLTENDINENLQKYGPNTLATHQKKSHIANFLKHYVQPFNILLLIAALLSFIVYFLTQNEYSNLFLGLGIFSVSVINTFIELYQEYTTSSILDGFKNLVPEMCLSTREYQKGSFEAIKLVVGDLVYINLGDKVPADIRLIEAKSLKIDDSSLTGESEPVNKRVCSIENGSYTHAENMVFTGTMVVNGEGTGIVVSTGENTILGKIAKLTTMNTNTEPELVKEINTYIKRLGLVAMITSIVFYLVSMYNGFLFTDTLSFCIGLFIAFVPQGLPATVTILLCIAAKRMGRRQVLVKDLRAVETLGSISILATDKTGTLTEGKMKCVLIWDGDVYHEDKWDQFKRLGEIGILTSKIIKVSKENKDVIRTDAEKSREGHIENESKPFSNNVLNLRNIYQQNDTENNIHELQNAHQLKDPQGMSRSCYFNNDHKQDTSRKGSIDWSLETKGDILSFSNMNDSVFFRSKPKPKPNKFEKCSASVELIGSPTEMALFKLSESLYKGDSSNENLIYEDPFNSDKKYQLCITESSNHYNFYLKGAPEIIIKFCTLYTRNNATNKIDEEFLEFFDSHHSKFASQGQRLVSFAEKRVLKDYINIAKIKAEGATKDIIMEFNFLCMIGIVDPPKKGVRDAILKLRLAGIRVIMITGDHPLTAEYIAKMTHIISNTEKRNDYKTAIESIRSDDGSTKPDGLYTGDERITILTEKPKLDYSSKKSSLIVDDKLSQISRTTSNSGKQYLIINGEDLNTLNESDWLMILQKQELIFARTTPKQKLLIVEKFQKYGHIVGVSGDGVNDSPALKKANLGIAMNKTGSEVSKDAASMIILDDNFASIVAGVYEGRLVFVNLKKSIRYILSHITPQVIPFLLFATIGIPSPMSTLLLMFIDLFTEFFPAIALAFEEAEGNLMIEAPRKCYYEDQSKNMIEEMICKKDNKGNNNSLCDNDLLSWSYLEAGFVNAIGSLCAFFAVLITEGIPPRALFMSSKYFFRASSQNLIINGVILDSKTQLEILFKAQSAYFLSILIIQSFNLIACKRRYDTIFQGRNVFSNKLPILGAIFGLLFGFFITGTAILNNVLSSRQVSLRYLAIPVIIGFILLIWDHLRKEMRRRMLLGNVKDTDLMYRLTRSRLVEDRK